MSPASLTSRGQWLTRLERTLEAVQPDLAPIALTEDTRLGEDLGLDSLGFEELFARLKGELNGTLPIIQWFNALEASDGKVSTLLDLLEAHERLDV